MKDGYIKVAAATPKVKVADTVYNGQLIKALMKECTDNGAKVVVFPELCITGYTCQDLFWQDKLIAAAEDELIGIADYSRGLDGIFFIGLPYEINGMLYNMAAVVSRGEVLAMVPKTFLPNYNEFYEARHFASGENLSTYVTLKNGQQVSVDTDFIFSCKQLPKLKIAVELCEDLWTPNPPSIRHAMSGATVIVNLSASDEVTGKAIYRRELVSGQSARLICGYIYASAGDGESTQDVVYSGHNLICENGNVLAESKRFTNETIYSEFDVERIETERRRMTTFVVEDDHRWAEFDLEVKDTTLSRYVNCAPFVPADKTDRDRRCDEILMIQAMGLKKRLEHTNCKTAVIGISGGLDSTLALLVTVRAFDLLGKDHKDIAAVTMPGFGTTDRTYDNAVNLIKCLGATFIEVDIKDAVNIHFRDIGQDPSVHDVTYENGQARERTQILMDIANKENGMVIGTGDLSELALGWATYNGDHMSMYGVNSDVPKTLVKHIVRWAAENRFAGTEVGKVLLDVVDTPISPELTPADSAGNIKQKTEDLVGPYELHDFFLYNVMKFGYSPRKVFFLACKAFNGQKSEKDGSEYTPEVIAKWLRKFFWRFFLQQFKRSCSPDGPKVGSVALSPRGDWRMPTDAQVKLWLQDLDEMGF